MVLLLLAPRDLVAGPAEFKVLPLPPLNLEGLTDRAPRAHTQGLELVGNRIYVTARLESVAPHRALLLRTGFNDTQWETWDLTPTNVNGIRGALDHPGGMQTDGRRLWIPVAESLRHGRTVILAVALKQLIPGRPVLPDVEFQVADHIGALAVAADRQLLFGANWDTETVYIWDFQGHLKRILSGPELKSRNLGSVPGQTGRAVVAVQDWKMVGDRLFASGLFQESTTTTAAAPRSRLLIFTRFLEPAFNCQTISLPFYERKELAREAMAVSGGFVYYLPEDLGANDRLFRVPLADLLNP
jgi:hypothetical protein